jgi:hypothetical protein
MPRLSLEAVQLLPVLEVLIKACMPFNFTFSERFRGPTSALSFEATASCSEECDFQRTTLAAIDPTVKKSAPYWLPLAPAKSAAQTRAAILTANVDGEIRCPLPISPAVWLAVLNAVWLAVLNE